MFAWVPVSFLRYWKAWLSITGFDIESNFVSMQTYEDFILSGHSIIMSMKIFSVFFQVIHFSHGVLAQTAVRNCSQCYVDLLEGSQIYVSWIWLIFLAEYKS